MTLESKHYGAGEGGGGGLISPHKSTVKPQLWKFSHQLPQILLAEAGKVEGEGTKTNLRKGWCHTYPNKSNPYSSPAVSVWFEEPRPQSQVPVHCPPVGPASPLQTLSSERPAHSCWHPAHSEQSKITQNLLKSSSRSHKNKQFPYL